MRVAPYMAVFETFAPDTPLQLSEVLSDFKLVIREQVAYQGRAIVHGMVSTGVSTLYEVTLGEFWLDVDLLTLTNVTGGGERGFNSFLQEWQKMYKVLPEYKVAVADIQTFLADLRSWLDQVELATSASLKLRNSPGQEIQFLKELGASTTPAIDALFDRFEEVAAKIDPDLQVAHSVFGKRQLHQLILCSPFMYRTFHKPLGYAGDYEMVNMIVGEPLQGNSLFAKIVNLWFLQQPPAIAHRNRIAYLQGKLQEETGRASVHGERAKIFNLGCGPAAEIQGFLAENSLCNKSHFTLVDFNEETLLHTAAALDGIKDTRHRSTEIEFQKKSVVQLLKESERSSRSLSPEVFDLVYCAGMFDYLSDELCRRLLEALYRAVAPGGLLIATNVDKCNPRRRTMDYLMEWFLLYRDRKQLGALAPACVARENLCVKSDETGVNVYLEIRKPELHAAN